MTKYHVSEFDIDTVTLFLAMLCSVLLCYICFSKTCPDWDMDLEESDEVPTAFATALSIPREIECPTCHEFLTIVDSDSD